MGEEASNGSERCPACGLELPATAVGWCPRCGAATLAAEAGWELGSPPSGEERYRTGTESVGQDSAQCDPEGRGSAERGLEEAGAGGERTSVGRRRAAWPARLKSRRALPWLAAAVLLAAGAAVGGFFAGRGGGDEAVLFPVYGTAAGTDELGFIDKRGTTVIPVGAYMRSGDSRFADGLAPVFKDDKAGYIDATGRMVISPRFNGANGFKEGRALVWHADGCAYIDTGGNYVVPPGLYDEGRDFSDGLAAVEVNQGGESKWGFIDRAGKLAIEPTFDAVGDFFDGRAPAAIVDNGSQVWGYLDKSGSWAIQPRFFYADQFSEGLAAVAGGSASSGSMLWGYIDTSGTEVVEPHFAMAGRFSEGLAYAAEPRADGPGPVGFIDGTGAWVIEPQFSSASGFSQGLAAVGGRSPERWGYVDHEGAWVIEPQFAVAMDFLPEGLAMVYLGDGSDDATTTSTAPAWSDTWYPPAQPAQWLAAYIDRTGKIVWKEARP